MRQDQYERLVALSEKLTDALLLELDPEQWPGASLAPMAMDQQTRGDRYWCKKNAAATLTLIMKNNSLFDLIRRQTAGGGGAAEVPPGAAAPGEDDEDSGLDAEIRRAEKEAAQVLARAQKAAGAPR
ncbi:hypothetical protein [Achromobacter sp. 2789STDY5608628]|uniref:hypothetical protein n=1 Tax=Achromobacter sp. 2789STDY5608628 TaxID=1806493 RepID=UPI0006C230AF|nr:hypothetical protein [Achromobacter sp. 2789STDY5608628]CUJ67316.1 Uncharacterised protein [Achromobacter sp. 2789STDY5608628]